MENYPESQEVLSPEPQAFDTRQNLSDLALERTALAQASACLDQATSRQLEDLCLGPHKAFTLPLLSSKRLQEFHQRIHDKSPKSEGLGTIEIVIIIAVLLALALLFREKITAFAQELMDKVFDSSILSDL